MARRKECATGMKIQTFHANLDEISYDDAVAWLRSHGYRTSPDYSKTRNTVRFRQHDPAKFDKASFGWGDEFVPGLKPLYGCPKSRWGEMSAPAEKAKTLSGPPRAGTTIRQGDLVNFQDQFDKRKDVSAFDEGTLVGVFLEHRPWGYIVDTPTGKKGIEFHQILAEQFAMDDAIPEFERWLDEHYPVEEGDSGKSRGLSGSPREGMRTPWGLADSVEKIADGIWFVGTPGHGGIKLDASKNRLIPEFMRMRGGWYEEDVDWAIPGLVFAADFATHFPKFTISEAIDVLKRYHPDMYRALEESF